MILRLAGGVVLLALGTVVLLRRRLTRSAGSITPVVCTRHPAGMSRVGRTAPASRTSTSMTPGSFAVSAISTVLVAVLSLVPLSAVVTATARCAGR